MSRTEFMRQLESLLQNISPTEREEALQYYNDYFDDAGPENEQDVLDALGNPARVAESIKRDQTINRAPSKGAYRGETENDFRHEDSQGNSVRHPIVKQSDSQSRQEEQSGSGQSKTEEMPTWQIVLWIVLGIVLSPVAISVITGLVSALFGLVVAWFSLILGFGFAAVVLVALLFVLGAVGVANLLEAPIMGVGLIGGGLICGGIGILFLMLTVALAGIVTPAIFKGIGQLWRFLKGKMNKEVIA